MSRIIRWTDPSHGIPLSGHFHRGGDHRMQPLILDWVPSEAPGVFQAITNAPEAPVRIFIRTTTPSGLTSATAQRSYGCAADPCPTYVSEPGFLALLIPALLTLWVRRLTRCAHTK